MPYFDGTGPLGEGPRTGRGLGPCGRGLSWKHFWGRGLGWRRRMSEEDSLAALEKEKEDLTSRLKEIEEQIDQFKKQNSKE